MKFDVLLFKVYSFAICSDKLTVIKASLQKLKLHSRIGTYSTLQCLTSKLNFVNGERCHGEGDAVPFHYPATGQRMGEFTNSNANDVNKVVQIAMQAQKKWAPLAFTDKAKILLRAADLIRRDANHLAYVDTMDTGKPLWESLLTVDECANSLLMFAGFIGTIQGSHTALPDSDFFYTRAEPLGVCLGIGAWNYPFQMSVWKSAPALAAGNSFIFKPSPETPQSAVKLGELYREAGLPNGLYNVLQGDGSTCAQVLCEHPGVHKVSFTGSVATGKKVMCSATQNGLRRITLELGGKSPLIVFEDANLNEAVVGTIFANFFSQGEVCSNAARVYVHKKVVKEFTARLLSTVAKFIVGDPMLQNVDMGAMINAAHANKVLGYIKSAKEQGAKVLFGGERLTMKDPLLKNGYFLPPTVLTDCHDQMTSVKEEIFGPVITLLTFETEEDVIERCNHSDLGLAAGLFTENLARAHRVAGLLEAGSVFINTFNNFPPGLPFAGWKSSGLGCENARETLSLYMQNKSVFVKGSPHTTLLFPSLSK